MAQTRRPQHPNAALTPTQRLKMVRLVEDGWSVAAAAQRFQVDDKTTRKWLDRARAAARAKRAWGTAAAGPVTARGALPSRNDSG